MQSRSGFGAMANNPFDCNGHANTNGHAAGYLPLNGICVDEGGSRDGSGHGHSRSLASNGPDIRGFIQGRRGSSMASDELSFRRMESSGSILLCVSASTWLCLPCSVLPEAVLEGERYRQHCLLQSCRPLLQSPGSTADET